jgi:hypothetical protein
MRVGVLGLVLGVALTVGTLGCSSSTSPSNGETLSLAGKWSGTWDSSPNVATLTQAGSTIGGTITMWTGISGTLSGSISGDVLTLTISGPAGTYSAYGAPTCSMTATETFKVSATSIQKIFTENWSPSCVPTVVPQATTGRQLTLTKQ